MDMPLNCKRPELELQALQNGTKLDLYNASKIWMITNY